MNKIILSMMLFLIVTSYSNADYLHTSSNNICVYDLTPYQNNTGWCYVSRNDGLTYCDAALSYSSLLDGYNLVGADCVVKNDLKLTGLTENQWNYSLAFLAHALGFTMFFLINYLSILIARK